jgi:hypothetical protein
MKIVEPTDRDEAWAERLEEGSHTSKLLVARIGRERVAIKVMVALRDDDLLDKAVRTLAAKEAR